MSKPIDIPVEAVIAKECLRTTAVNRPLIKEETYVLNDIVLTNNADGVSQEKMTNDDAVLWLKQIKERYIKSGDEEFDRCRKEAIDMAIEALCGRKMKGAEVEE